MKSLVDQLSQYASYHRDRRNIATHFVGIPDDCRGYPGAPREARRPRPGFPLAVAALATLAAGGLLRGARPPLRGGDGRGARGEPLARSAVAAMSTVGWLLVAAGLFGRGWVVQFVGHGFEGRKPAFVDDLVGLLMGPLFIVAEVGFALGLRDEVPEAVEGRAGRTHGRTGRPAPSAWS